MIYEKIQEDVKTAMKEHNSEKLLALRTLVSDIKNVGIRNGRKEPTDDDSLQALTKAIKQREDSAEQFKNGGRIELAENELKQVIFFKVYMPEQMSEDEVRTIVSDIVAKLGATTKKDIGRVMKEIGPAVKGKADMKLVNQILSGMLA